MFGKVIYVFVITILFSGLNAQSLQLYPYKSGVIKYKIQGRTNGVETIHFDDYGRVASSLKIVANHSDLVTRVDSILTISRNDSVFELNFNTKIIMVSSISENYNGSKQKIILSNTLMLLGFSENGYENVAGKKCIKFSDNNGSLWVWNNIVLKSKMKIMNVIIATEATSIMINIDIPKSKFEIPGNYKIKNKIKK